MKFKKKNNRNKTDCFKKITSHTSEGKQFNTYTHYSYILVRYTIETEYNISRWSLNRNRRTRG